MYNEDLCSAGWAEYCQPMSYPTNPTFPTGLGNVKITTPQVQAGQTTLDKILSTTLSLFALHKGAGYVPTTTQPQNQYSGYQLPPEYYANLAAGGGSTGATFGASIEQFVTQNSGLLLVGVVALVLFRSGRK